MLGLVIEPDFKEYLEQVAAVAKAQTVKADSTSVCIGVNTSIMRAAFWMN